jgi:UDP-N-acetylglucosamine 2-epimerase (non-hydrolysing)
MKTKKILVVVGTRPNFIKVTQLKKEALNFPNLELKIVHTGQHYDPKMADVFFEQFKLIPDYFLNIEPASANSQMAEIMIKLEKLILEYKPDLLMVVGDVNSTFAAALTGYKLGIKLAHLESGLRSQDRSMPEEINRILTDEITDYFFVTEQSGIDNLAKEGKLPDRVYFVGNTMIDTMVAFNANIVENNILEILKIEQQKYLLVTMHRPATVDSEEGLDNLLNLFDFLTLNYKVVFPIHPRTLSKIEYYGFNKRIQQNKNIIITEPLDYFSFQKLICEARTILTDSGGIQEESTFRKIPCLTLRPNTERPSTVTIGSNKLMPFSIEEIGVELENVENNTFKNGGIPPLWDGLSSQRIIKILNAIL